MKKAYIGGMFNNKIIGGKWLLDLEHDIRTYLVGDINKYDKNLIIKGTDIGYIGPFYCELSENGDKKLVTVGYEVVKRELEMIDDADIIVVYLNNNISAGTSVELTYASIKHKKVIIIYAEYNDMEDNEYCENKECRNEHWFAIESSILLNRENTKIIKIPNATPTKEVADLIVAELNGGV